MNFNDVEVTPFRLAEEYAYGFLVQDKDNKILIIPDELSNWNPDNRFDGLDLAILPIGVLEYHPSTRERFVVFDILKFPKVDGIACPELVDYNVRI